MIELQRNQGTYLSLETNDDTSGCGRREEVGFRPEAQPARSPHQPQVRPQPESLDEPATTLVPEVFHASAGVGDGAIAGQRAVARELPEPTATASDEGLQLSDAGEKPERGPFDREDRHAERRRRRGCILEIARRRC